MLLKYTNLGFQVSFFRKTWVEFSRIRLKLFIMGRPKKVFVFDIDNTIALTYPSFFIPYSNDFQRYACLAIYPAMRSYVVELINRGERIFYFSARPWYVFPTTYKWLKSQGIIRSLNQLYTVPNVKDKIKLLSCFPLQTQIYYFDDLSYNHENGMVKFYTDVINSIRSMKNVKYFGIDTIQYLQGLWYEREHFHKICPI